MSFSLGLSQNCLVKMGADILCDHTDDSDYNKTIILAFPTFNIEMLLIKKPTIKSYRNSSSVEEYSLQSLMADD